MADTIRITAKTTFKHGEVCFDEGKTYDVPAGVGGYFVANGWAIGPDGEENDVLKGEHIIEVHDGAMGSGSTKAEFVAEG